MNKLIYKRQIKVSIPYKKRVGLKYLLMSLPFIFFVLAFSYVPLFGWSFAFFDYKPGIPISKTTFVGISNFLKLFAERGEILRVLRNTFAMSFLGILSSPLPIIFAIMLNDIKNMKFKKLVQTATTLPNFISWIVVFGLAFSIFSSNGLLNNILMLLNQPVPEISILGNNTYVWFFQLALGIWKSIGWSAIIYLAAISGIDEELYCAAGIDGANRLQKIIHITIPGLMPTYLVLLLLSVSNILSNGFDQYFVFYNSLVSDKIEVLDYYVYKVGILINDYPYSIAIGMLKTLISITILFSVNRISRGIRGDALV